MKIKLLAIILGVLCLAGATGEDNLLDNAGFENWADNYPVQWVANIWDSTPGITEIHPGTAHPYAGNTCAVIENKQPNDARLVYEISAEKNRLYEFSCRIRTADVGMNAVGANISLIGQYNVFWDIRGTTNEWRRSVIYLLTGSESVFVRLSLGLGSYGSLNTGTAMFDSVKFRRITAIEEQNPVVIRPGTGVLNISEYRRYMRNYIIKNGSFENWQDKYPDDWRADIRDTFAGVTEITYDEINPHSGDRALVIYNKEPNDSHMLQDIAVAGDKLYELSCWVKTENIGMDHTGACISIPGLSDITWDLRGTNSEWRKMTVYLRTGRNTGTITICVGIGGFANINTGKAFFDSLSITPVDHVYDYDSTVINAGGGVLKVSNANIKPHTSLEVSLLLLFFILNTGLAVLYSVFRRKNKPVLAALFPFKDKPADRAVSGKTEKGMETADEKDIEKEREQK